MYRGIGGEMDRENEDITLDDVNSETFGDSFRYGTNQQFSEISQRKNNGAQATSSSSSRVCFWSYLFFIRMVFFSMKCPNLSSINTTHCMYIMASTHLLFYIHDNYGT